MDMKHLLSVIDNAEKLISTPAKPVLTENKLAKYMKVLAEAQEVETLPAVAIEENPVDSVTVDIPLLIRLLEYSKEDAKTDMDLHNVAERMIEMSKEGKTLSMDDYDAICGAEQPTEVTENQSDDAAQMETLQKIMRNITESRQEVRKYVLRVMNVCPDEELKGKMKSHAQLLDNMMASVNTMKANRYSELRRK